MRLGSVAVSVAVVRGLRGRELGAFWVRGRLLLGDQFRRLVRLEVGAALRSLAFVSWREGRRLVVLVGGDLVVVALCHVAGLGSAGVVVLCGAAVRRLLGGWQLLLGSSLVVSSP